MEDSVIDLTRAGYTSAAVLGFMQALKKSPWVRNDRVPLLSLLFGLIIGLGDAGLTGALQVLEDGLAIYPQMLRLLFSGALGGAGAVVEYDVQKQAGQKIGFVPLGPAPENHPADKAKHENGGEAHG